MEGSCIKGLTSRVAPKTLLYLYVDNLKPRSAVEALQRDVRKEVVKLHVVSAPEGAEEARMRPESSFNISSYEAMP